MLPGLFYRLFPLTSFSFSESHEPLTPAEEAETPRAPSTQQSTRFAQQGSRMVTSERNQGTDELQGGFGSRNQEPHDLREKQAVNRPTVASSPGPLDAKGGSAARLIPQTGRRVSLAVTHYVPCASDQSH
eukprot:3173929-Rhodomonas_salina.3